MALPVFIDAGQFEQVVTNLVINARDSMPEGGEIRIRTSITQGSLPGQAPKPMARIEVQDTGHGISPEIQQEIFEPFFTTKEVGYGTGLGLATVLKIVQDSGGYIDLDSEMGRGTVFAVYLPMNKGEIVGEQLAPKDRIEKGSGHILVVEDDAYIRRSTSKLLERAGFTTATAIDGQAALALLVSGATFDLVLSDVVMPQMTGVELRAAIKENWPDLPVQLMTGYADASALPLEERAGILSKPFQPGDLVRAIQSTLDRE
jgi:two-component system cell cycle sensor histidine kinase/response regulator CckA